MHVDGVDDDPALCNRVDVGRQQSATMVGGRIHRWAYPNVGPGRDNHSSTAKPTSRRRGWGENCLPTRNLAPIGAGLYLVPTTQVSTPNTIWASVLDNCSLRRFQPVVFVTWMSKPRRWPRRLDLLDDALVVDDPCIELPEERVGELDERDGEDICEREGEWVGEERGLGRSSS